MRSTANRNVFNHHQQCRPARLVIIVSDTLRRAIRSAIDAIFEWFWNAVCTIAEYKSYYSANLMHDQAWVLFQNCFSNSMCSRGALDAGCGLQLCINIFFNVFLNASSFSIPIFYQCMLLQHVCANHLRISLRKFS